MNVEKLKQWLRKRAEENETRAKQLRDSNAVGIAITGEIIRKQAKASTYTLVLAKIENGDFN